MELSDAEISILKDILDLIGDRVRHYPDAAMGWGADEVATFHSLDARFMAEAKARNFWWAQR